MLLLKENAMHSKPVTVISHLFKRTKLWKENRLILREIRHFPKIVAIAIAAPFGAAVFEGSSIGFLLVFLQNLVSPNAVPIHIGIDWFDTWILGIHTSETSRLLRVSGLILLSIWIRAGFNYLSFVYNELTRHHLVDRLYKQIFDQLQSVSLSYFGKTRSGEIINTFSNEVSQLQQAVGGISFLLSKTFVLSIYTIIAMRISWQLTLLSLLLFGSIGVGLSKLNARVREKSFPVSQARGHMMSVTVELVNGIRTIQAFATQKFEEKRFNEASAEVLQAASVSTRTYAMIRPLAEGLASTVLISMIIVGMTVFVSSGVLQTASLLTFLFTLMRLVPAMQEISGNLAVLSSFQGAIQNIERLLRRDDKPYLRNGLVEFQGLQKAIELISVDFSYDGKVPVLENVTLSIKKGETIAFVGGSGAGKSTLVDLIPRFYDVTQGSILFDGVDVRKFDINSVRRRIAVVSQDTFIFNTSVRNNIAYGLESVVDDVVFEAAQLANALDFILEMPLGFETVLGDRGVRLSGGQRQRIAIARALLRNPEILILDEATSALDSVSERLIQESLEKLSVGRTVIAIAHRLSTIVRADKVIVLEQGRIVEQGTYDELLNQRGKLWNYHQMQHNSQPIL